MPNYHYRYGRYQKRYPKTHAYNMSRITRDYTLGDQMRDELEHHIRVLERKVAALQIYILQNQRPAEPVIRDHVLIEHCPKCGKPVWANEPHIHVFGGGSDA